MMSSTTISGGQVRSNRFFIIILYIVVGLGITYEQIRYANRVLEYQNEGSNSSGGGGSASAALTLPTNATTTATTVAAATVTSSFENVTEKVTVSTNYPRNIDGNVTTRNVSHVGPSSVSIDDPKNSFAACVMIMDDSHFLIEWLAYHYHVMPLRYVIFLMDPKSKTTPLPILQRWQGRIQYELWDIKNVFPPYGRPQFIPTNSHNLYVRTQQEFVEKCLQRLQDKHRSWVLVTDIDEYVMVNPRVYEPGERLHRHIVKATQTNKYSFSSQNKLGYVWEALHHPGFKSEVDHHHPACVPISRKQFGTLERHEIGIEIERQQQQSQSQAGKQDRKGLSTTTNNNDNTPKISPIERYQHRLIAGHFNTSSMQTTNFMGYHPRDAGYGKAMVDLSRIPRNMTIVDSIHVPIQDICQRDFMLLKANKNVFVANHYQGTYQQMLFRTNDARGGGGKLLRTLKNDNDINGTSYRLERYQNFRRTKFMERIELDSVEGWVDEFVTSVGIEEAQRLLDGVGDPTMAAEGGWLVPPDASKQQ